MSIATAEDFEQKAMERCFEAPEELPLPSGLVVLARRPKPLWWLIQNGQLPGRSPAVVDGAVSTEALTEEERERGEAILTRVLESVIVEPKIRTNPQAREVNRIFVDDSDIIAILKWARGEMMTDDGQSLDTFRSIKGGTGGAALELPPK
jgi:hypothetical protein